MRKCGECTLCCKLLPVVSLAKKANEKCKFQKFHKGCSIYQKPKFPIECRIWNCNWLLDKDTHDLARPDRSHYVIDHMPDNIYIKNNETGEEKAMTVCVVWCDPDHPDAHRDPKLREYFLRRADEGIAAMVRYNSYDSIVIFAPRLCTEKRWMEVHNTATKMDPNVQRIDESLREIYKEKFE